MSDRRRWLDVRRVRADRGQERVRPGFEDRFSREARGRLLGAGQREADEAGERGGQHHQNGDDCRQAEGQVTDPSSQRFGLDAFGGRAGSGRAGSGRRDDRPRGCCRATRTGRTVRTGWAIRTGRVGNSAAGRFDRPCPLGDDRAGSRTRRRDPSSGGVNPSGRATGWPGRRLCP